MNSKKILITKEYDIKNISEVKSILGLLIHLTDFPKLQKFITMEWKVKEPEVQGRSYSFFLFLVLDKLFRIISDLPEIDNFNYDYKLYRGLQTNNHFSVIATDSRRSRICYEIFKQTIDIVKTNDGLKAILDNLRGVYVSFYSTLEPFTNIKIEPNLFSISNYIENLLEPLDFPIQVNVEFNSILSHFFEGYYDYLDYFKDNKGEWIITNGFFVALIYSYKFFLGENVFNECKETLLIDDLPFENFSPEINAFFPNFFESNTNNQTTKSINSSLFITQDGILTIFKKTDKSMSELYKRIFAVSHSHLYESYSSKKYKEIIIDNLQIRSMQKKIDNLPRLKERFSLPKLFDYNKIFSLELYNSIQTGLTFQILIDGLNIFCKDHKQVSNMVFIESDENNKCEIAFDKQIPITKVQKISLYHITSEKRFKQIYEEKSNFEKIGTTKGDPIDFDNKKYGVFREIKVYGTAGNDHTFWLGSFFYGSKDNSAESANLQSLLDEIRNNKNKYNIDHYIFDFSFYQYLLNNFSNIPLLDPSRTNPFSLFFNSVDDIENQIKLNNFHTSYSLFLESFQEEDTDNKTKKDALENLAKDIFSMSRQFEVLQMNFIDSSEEIDLIVETKPLIPDLSELLGKVFLVECRNMNSKVTPKQIRDFGSKLPKYSLKTGIIIARESTTGKDQDKGAKREIRDFANRGYLILVLDMNDLEDISQGKSVSSILFRSFCRMYFRGLKNMME
jgi:hypothetical protein